MVIGVLKEIKPNEYRVAAVPATVSAFAQTASITLANATLPYLLSCLLYVVVGFAI